MAIFYPAVLAGPVPKAVFAAGVPNKLARPHIQIPTQTANLVPIVTAITAPAVKAPV